MSRRRIFRPRITRIKLNHEQAVLQCDCYWGLKWDWSSMYWAAGAMINFCTGARPGASSGSTCQGSGIGLAGKAAASGGFS